VRPEGLGKFLKIHLIENRTRDLLVCRIVPPYIHTYIYIYIYTVRDEGTLGTITVKADEMDLQLNMR
jgi:hypothetical protein